MIQFGLDNIKSNGIYGQTAVGSETKLGSGRTNGAPFRPHLIEYAT